MNESELKDIEGDLTGKSITIGEGTIKRMRYLTKRNAELEDFVDKIARWKFSVEPQNEFDYMHAQIRLAMHLAHELQKERQIT